VVRNGGANDILATKRLVALGAEKRLLLGMCADMPCEMLFLGEGPGAPGAYTLAAGVNRRIGHYLQLEQRTRYSAEQGVGLGAGD
jgi:hypothetical protein